MNLVRKAIHAFMESTGLDRRVNHYAVNGWLERQRGKRYSIVPADDANRWLAEVICAGHPTAVGKIGDRECCALAAHLRLRQFYKYTWTAPSYSEADLHQQAGVFPPTADTYCRFSEIFLERLRNIDACAVWHNPGESEILNRYCPAVRRLELQALEPYFFTPPWSAQLAAKRVLVVHPFEFSIRAQIARRDLVWSKMPDVLPECEIEIIRAPFGFANTDFRDWFEMLQWLEDRVEEAFARRQFQVALIGCGAAGIPLAAKVKELGGIGIHIGGPLQLLFGICGRRWEKLPGFDRIFNEFWIRPSSEETPDTAGAVDNGGYW
jgi:hypothetical protein